MIREEQKYAPTLHAVRTNQAVTGVKAAGQTFDAVKRKQAVTGRGKAALSAKETIQAPHRRKPKTPNQPERPETREMGKTYGAVGRNGNRITGMSALMPGVRSSSGPGIDREALIKKCNVRENRGYFSGVSSGGQKAAKILSNESKGIRENPAVCSIEERKRIQEARAAEEAADWLRKTEDEEEKDETGKQALNEKPDRQETADARDAREASAVWGDPADGNRRKQDDGQMPEKQKMVSHKGGGIKGSLHGTKKRMIRSFMIQELIREDGKTDPYSHMRFTGRMLVYDMKQALASPARLLWSLIKKLLLLLLPYLLAAFVILFSFLFVGYILMSPVSYFMGLYDSIGFIKEKPFYIKNTVQEMYQSFYGGIDAFADSDGNNEVIYEYGRYSDSRAVTAVYLAQISKAGDEKLLEDEDGYPPYLLVDTYRERKLLEEVFWQFNHTQTEAVEKTVMGEDGNDYQVTAGRMTVTCLTLEQWKEQYLSGLNQKEQRLLEQYLKQENMDSEIDGSYTGGTSIPIEDLFIPEGQDENLVYLAGFIKAEAGNQPYQGRLAVAYVILNRAGGSGGNIKGVLTAPYQFSCYIPYHTVEAYLQEYAIMTDSERASDANWQAASAAYYGTDENPIGSMKYYCNPKYCTVGEDRQWQKIHAKNTKEEITLIGDHVFCQNCW